MNIFLINVPIRFNAFENNEPPLGIAYLAAVLRKDRAHSLRLADFEVEPFRPADLLARIRDFDPRIVGISCRTASYPSAVELLRLIRDNFPDILLVLGGHHPSAMPMKVLEENRGHLDFVVRGEGEETFPALIDAIAASADLTRVAGIGFYGPRGPVLTEPRPLVPDIDALPLPATDLLEMRRYAYATILTSRGCPYDCIYCDKSVSTRKVRFRSAQSIIGEIRAYRERHGIGYFYFVDDNFLLFKDRTREVLERVVSECPGIRWICQASINAIDAGLMRLARTAGCETVIFGVESGDPGEREFIRKVGSPEDVARAVSVCREQGIRVRANFMLGFPVSTPGSVANSIRFARKLDADIYRFFVVTPLPNTDLWEYLRERGVVPEHLNWQHFNFYDVAFPIVKDIPREELTLWSGTALWHVYRSRLPGELVRPRNFVRFVREYRARRRLPTALFFSYPVFANLASQLWFLTREMSIPAKLAFLARVLHRERELRAGAKTA